MSSKAKRRAEPERKSPRKSKKVKYCEDSDESEGDAYIEKDDFEDELQALAASNIIHGRRTRGIKVDYTKVDGFTGEDEDVDEETAEVRRGLSEKKRAKDTSRSPAKPASHKKIKKEGGKGNGSTSSKVLKTPKSTNQGIPLKPKKRAVYESEIDEESEEHHSDTKN
ncbi:hypothetical protein QCA50_012415 [Cerrena zonata]|uniref:Histone chaperone domain-containing protein n=1 Tax=Cerrena zonata TaxID=2478898 RepID=A0AAW0G3F8_9APHY